MKLKSSSQKVDQLMNYLEDSPYRVLGYTVPKTVVEEILKMPKQGKKISYSQAREKQIQSCIQGPYVNFDPAQESIVRWASRNGYYIEFTEEELEF